MREEHCPAGADHVMAYCGDGSVISEDTRARCGKTNFLLKEFFPLTMSRMWLKRL
jgi:hypothetical protein